MNPRKIHILYEYGTNLRPHASASLRLVRPFTHPLLRDQVELTLGRTLQDGNFDVVIIDRLWRPDITLSMVDDLAAEVRRRGAKLLFWFDDNLLLLRGQDDINARSRECFQRFLDLCDGVVVSTDELRKAFNRQSRVVFLLSALDERLIAQKVQRRAAGGKITIGYMGSSTHDEDLRLVLPALRSICEKYPGTIRLQFTGVINREKLEQWEDLRGLPVEIVQPAPFESEYQAFLLWFTGEVRWDIGIAPLVENEFNLYKSDIKFLDYTAAAVPGIFSAVPAYQSTIEDNRTGFLVENTTAAWTAALEQMIVNEKLRSRLLQNATRYLYGSRILAQCAPNWMRAVDEASGA